MEVQNVSLKRYSAERKVEILREHFKNNIAVSEICSKQGINASIFYRWEKELFEAAIEAFSKGNKKSRNGFKSYSERVMEEKIRKQQEIITWLTEENLKLKKNLGQS